MTESITDKKNTENNYNSSTTTIIQNLLPEKQNPKEDDIKEKEKNSNLYSRLKKYNLGNDSRIINIIAAYPKYVNRLISLFKIFKESKIILTDELEQMISLNISNIGGIINLITVAKELDINTENMALNPIFKAANSDSIVEQSARSLHEASILDDTTFNLLLSYPNDSLQLSQLMINLQKHAYSPISLVNKLRTNLIAVDHMNSTIEFLNLLLENEIYDIGVVDILIRQEQFIDIIYEGAKKLAANPDFLAKYLEFIENNPRNANIFVKNILLLNQSHLLNPSANEDRFCIVNNLGIGAYHLMNLLQQTDLLDAKNYDRICQGSHILEREDLVIKLINLPMITHFQKNELLKILDLITRSTINEKDIQEVCEIVEKHHLHYQPSGSSVCLSN